MLHDVKYNITEVLNDMIRDSQNSISDDSNMPENGHIFITVKFYKFTDKDKSQSHINEELRVFKIIYLNFL